MDEQEEIIHMLQDIEIIQSQLQQYHNNALTHKNIQHLYVVYIFILLGTIFKYRQYHNMFHPNLLLLIAIFGAI